jgi:DNA recombination protein RmuC
MSISPAIGLALLVFCVLVGAALGWLAGRSAAGRAAEAARAAALAKDHADRLEGERRHAAELQRVGQEAAALRARSASVEEQLVQAGAQMQALRDTLETQSERLLTVEREKTRLTSELAAERSAGQERLEAARIAEQERAEAARAAEAERKQFFESTRADLSHYFQKIAAEILEDKSKRFTEHNRSNIELLLQPLREKLGEFGERVENLQKESVAGRGELRGHIETLRGLNERLSTDAGNLVKALKNSSKQQGDWGEVILIEMLTSAGLRAGIEFRMQESFANEEGRHVRPDIILNLPDEKHLVIDSKVSLTAYADYCACEDDTARKSFLDRHARSLRGHIDGLNKKKYEQLHQLRSLDFVVMFVPIEPAYLLALAHDAGLWQRAWEKDVLVVSPGTLFPVIRTIAHMWQQERQTRNVEEIVRQGGALYDKVALFAAGFEDVGKKIGAAQGSYDKAYSQLTSGSGNVLSRIERLRKLGVRSTKAMPKGMLASEEELGLPTESDPSEPAGLFENSLLSPGEDREAPE